MRATDDVAIAATVPERGRNRRTQPWPVASDPTALPERETRSPATAGGYTKVGRYHLLEKVGSGGMGVVWGAWDPELERRVAIKLVQTELAAARARILLEGQALAKLSHPNIVPIYDVGIVGDDVYLVMEWVRGMNLRAYCAEKRSVREILAVFRAAGEGLSASHRAGIIHRDFKPENAVIGDDGRVRVLDFGLARGEVRADDLAMGSSHPSLTRGAGTPRFMPPEQAEGRELTPAVDQYAFCVSVREALVGRGGIDAEPEAVPGWIAPLLDRGTSVDASRRFASMDELLRQLSRDPATIWRRRLAIAGVLGVAGAAFAMGSLRRGDAGVPTEPCTGAPQELARTWGADHRARVISHVASLGPYGAAEAPRLADMLDTYARQWMTTDREACHARHRGELTSSRYEQHQACSTRTRYALDTAVGLLSTVGGDRIAAAIVAVDALPSPERCTIEARSTTIDPPAPTVAGAVADLDNELARVRVLAHAQQPGAIEAAAAAAAKAEQLGYLPLVARAQLLHGFAMLIQEGDTALARVATLQRALANALEAGDQATAVEAYARLIPELAMTSTRELPAGAKDVLGGIPLVAAMARRLDPNGAFARALLYNNIGTIHFAAGDRTAAARWFEDARVAREPIREQYPELAIVLENLALVAHPIDERIRLAEGAAREIESRLGRDHPSAITARVNAAMLVPDPARSLAALREACGTYRSVHPHLEASIGACSFELGWLAYDIGDLAESRAAMAAIAPASDYEHAIAGGYRALLDARPRDAIAIASTLADEYVASDDPWTRFRGVDALIVVAASQQQLGATDDAITTLRRALAALRAIAGPFESGTFYRRRVAHTHAALARLLGPRERREAREHAEAALVWYRGAGRYERIVDELERL